MLDGARMMDLERPSATKGKLPQFARALSFMLHSFSFVALLVRITLIADVIHVVAVRSSRFWRRTPRKIRKSTMKTTTFLTCAKWYPTAKDI